jgi:putative AbiEii toxin of type IV toxin-antitoxin system/AAA ATPase-like protein/uncharacterized protein DUF3696
MDTLTIRNLRCFSGPETVHLRPLTLLVGENSTGKSSLLAAIRLAWDIAYSLRRIDFNEEPFLLGAFDQIAHFRGGRAGRAHTFGISFETQARRRHRARSESPAESPATLRLAYGAEFRRAGSHPVIGKQTLRCENLQLAAIFPENGGRPTVEIRVGEKRTTRTFDEDEVRIRIVGEAPIDWRYMMYSILDLRRRGGRPPVDLTEAEIGEIEDIVMNARLGPIRRRPVAIAPVRTRPQRIYNPVSETPLPEGDHVPMVLAKTYFGDKERWGNLKKSLDRFGRASGLFGSLEIKPFGDHESDPFQIRVRIDGPPSNLIDVGYGVSQVLPILVDALLADRGDLYLLQQPEVHLHPRAQAELGSFFTSMVATQSKMFVIETHSDYLLDRVRMDIRDGGVLKPEDVAIFFFERQGLEVAIHPLTIDRNGNLQDVPDSYRQFFLNEERRFLGT